MRNNCVSLAAIFLLLILGSMVPDRAFADPTVVADEIDGFWYTEGRKGGIEFYQCDNKICGRFHWINPEGKDHLSYDIHNPDATKRDHPLCQMQFMGNFTPDGKGHYIDGWIYSPRDGATFSAQMTLVDHNTLDLRGYIFSPVLGETQVWTRADYMPNCSSGS